MTTIKLNRCCPYLTENVTLEVSDEIAVVLSTGGRQCDSYKRRKRERGECSLDVDPGFEPDVMFPLLTRLMYKEAYILRTTEYTVFQSQNLREQRQKAHRQDSPLKEVRKACRAISANL